MRCGCGLWCRSSGVQRGRGGCPSSGGRRAAGPAAGLRTRSWLSGSGLWRLSSWSSRLACPTSEHRYNHYNPPPHPQKKPVSFSLKVVLSYFFSSLDGLTYFSTYQGTNNKIIMLYKSIVSIFKYLPRRVAISTLDNVLYIFHHSCCFVLFFVFCLIVYNFLYSINKLIIIIIV